MTFTNGERKEPTRQAPTERSAIVQLCTAPGPTKTVSNSLRFQEHSDNISIAYHSERGWVVARLEENERFNSNFHTWEKDSMVVELNVDCTLCQLW